MIHDLQMPGVALFLACAAALGGTALAGATGPATLGWEARKGMLLRRLKTLSSRQPGRAAGAAGAGLIGLVLAGGALAAYAAAPSAPEQLPAEVRGVVGSGDQLSLQVAAGATQRTIKIGEEYKDGWKLQALTPAKATLAKDGATREVGLNPDGALATATPAAPPSQVRVLMSDEEILAQVRAHPVRGGQPMPGLTAAETERYQLLMAKGGQLRVLSNPAPPAPPGGLITAGLISTADLIAPLGPEGAELTALLDKIGMGYYNDAVTAYQRYGPIQIPRSGDAQADSARMQDYPGARWKGGPDGYVMTMPATAPTLASAAPKP